MDTIEISNLNRQFLFRKRHVGKSKAETAAEAVRSFCPDAKIKTLQQNVKDSLFDLAFMKTFDIVLNGLDNDEARRHVNRLCLAAEVPLIESGTTGYKGQVCLTSICCCTHNTEHVARYMYHQIDNTEPTCMHYLLYWTCLNMCMFLLHDIPTTLSDLLWIGAAMYSHT